MYDLIDDEISEWLRGFLIHPRKILKRESDHRKVLFDDFKIQLDNRNGYDSHLMSHILFVIWQDSFHCTYHSHWSFQIVDNLDLYDRRQLGSHVIEYKGRLILYIALVRHHLSGGWYVAILNIFEYHFDFSLKNLIFEYFE